MKQLSRPQPRRRPYFRIFASASVAAAMGAFLGLRWATSHEYPDKLLGMYASAGAIVAVLGLRFGTLLFVVTKDYLGSRRR
ncbi:MAG: hypothetical protein U1E65_08345 [Myxococcota bacterium]